MKKLLVHAVHLRTCVLAGYAGVRTGHGTETTTTKTKKTKAKKTKKTKAKKTTTTTPAPTQ